MPRSIDEAASAVLQLGMRAGAGEVDAIVELGSSTVAATLADAPSCSCT